MPSDFVTRIVGSELGRVRSQTIYYVLSRIKGIFTTASAWRKWRDRRVAPNTTDCFRGESDDSVCGRLPLLRRKLEAVRLLKGV